MGLSVLVVDDSSHVRSRLRTMLSEMDGVSRVEDASGPVEARRLLASAARDLVVLDVHMPGGSGIDLLRDIRRGIDRPVVVVLTNYPASPYRRASLDAGADHFLDKSRDFERLADIVAELAGRSR